MEEQKNISLNTEKINSPKYKFSAGPIKVTVWENKSVKDEKEVTYSTITLERVYMDKVGDWQSTNIFRLNDLPKVNALLNKVYQEVTIKEVTV